MIYLAQPYSHEDGFIRWQRFTAGQRVAAEYLKRGEHVYSPIAMCHPIAELFDMPTEFDFWDAFDKDMIGRVDVVHVLKLDGWEESRGVAAEIAYAESIGKPVVFVEGEVHP